MSAERFSDDYSTSPVASAEVCGQFSFCNSGGTSALQPPIAKLVCSICSWLCRFVHDLAMLHFSIFFVLHR